MKRTLETIERELDAVHARERALWSERWSHPAFAARAQREARERLEKALPARLHAWLLDVDFAEYGPLRLITIEHELGVDDSGQHPDFYWSFRGTFARQQVECAVGMDWPACEATRGEPFDKVRFQPDAVRLWRDALEANDDNAGRALAALCFACCDHLDNWTALPADAYSPRAIK